MKQKNDGITQIKYGELHKFYPLKMDSSLNKPHHVLLIKM